MGQEIRGQEPVARRRPGRWLLCHQASCLGPLPSQSEVRIQL